MATGDDFILRIPMNLLLNIKDPVDRDVFMAAYSHMNNGAGECTASHRTISKRSTYSSSAVDYAMPRLVRNGYLEVPRRLAVRGGKVNVYVLSAHVVATYFTKVPTTAKKVPTTARHKQLNKHAAASIGEIPMKKPKSVSEKLWKETCSSYKKSLERYASKGDKVVSPGGLFKAILKDKAAEIGDHRYLASKMSDGELKAKISLLGKESQDQAYAKEAIERKLL